MREFIIGPDNRVALCQQVTLKGESLMLLCGCISMSALIRAAAYRGGIALRDQRATNF